ncbi:MAG: CAP domain-containing protein [Magnetococcus sp. DMHC-1]|nr:SCP-like extracellular [Magnetococcales bacterium]
MTRKRIKIAWLGWLALWASSVQAEVVQKGDISPADMAKAMVKRHNHHRSQVGVGGLAWSAKLANHALEWAKILAADGCKMRHRTDGLYGENIFWQSPIMWSDGRREVAKVNPDTVVDSWASEQKDYNYAQNTCTPGQVCGHYTQVVWRATEEVGCAMHICPDRGQIWVCNYHPHGNMVGEKPY